MDPRIQETQNTLAARRFGLQQEAKAEREREANGRKRWAADERERQVGEKDTKEQKGGDKQLQKQADDPPKRLDDQEKEKQNEDAIKPTLRVVAYSDSDSDVEDHFEMVKTHLLPAVEKLNIKADTGNKKVEKKDDVEEDLEANKKPAGTVAAGQLLSKISSLVFGTMLTAPAVVGSVILAGLERNVHPRVAQGAEMASAGVFLVRVLLAGLRGVPLSAGGTVSRASDTAAKASLVYEAFKWILRHQKGHRTGGARRNKLQRLGSHIQLDRLSSTERVELGDREPASMNDYAAAYNPEMREMRRILDACEVVLPTRFDDGNEELFRFAKACGILNAESKEDRALCIERAIRRVIQTVEAMSEKEFTRMPDNRLKRWERVVSWRGITPAGRPVLVVRLGRALQLTQNAPHRLDKFVHAVKTQVDIGIEAKMERSKFGTMVVVIDCGEITAWEAITNSRQLSGLAKSLTVFFTSHYPARLERAYLVDASMMVNRMFVSSVVSSLEQATKDKIVTTTNSDESLPVTLASLQKARSIVAGLSSVISDPTTVGSAADDSDADAGGDTDVEESTESLSAQTPGDQTTVNSVAVEESTEAMGTPDASVPALSQSTATPGDEFHTPFTKLMSPEGTINVSGGTANPDQTGSSDQKSIGSHVLQPTPMSEASIRGKLFSTTSSVDSLDLQSHLEQFPWSGLDLMLVFLLQPLHVFTHPENRRSHKPAISPTMRSSGLGFSRESSFNSLVDTEHPIPRPIRGGLLALPARPSRHGSRPTSASSAAESLLSSTRADISSSSRGTKLASPSKPSLRRDSSLAEEYMLQRESKNSLGSYPLPRQSSVSWAETLVNVREIDDIATIEWSDDRINDSIQTYIVALLLTAKVIKCCFV